jgi:hypothetical protein
MPTPIKTTLDFEGRRGITGLSAATSATEPVILSQLNSAIEGLAWKDDCRVATQANINLAAPGAAVDGVTMATSDRVLVRAQSAQTENGIYIWNGSAVPMTRAPDASTFDELEAATVTVTEGTSAGASFRQTAVNGVVGTNNVLWASFGTSAPAANETTAGIAEIATQAETDAGAADNVTLTPLKLANWSGRPRKNFATIGDGVATQYTVTHNFNTRDIQIYVYELTGNFREVFVEKRHTTVNAVDILFDAAPANGSHRVAILG